ncbi:MAG: hypothetical protein Q9204_009012, partial [Flavoplaca sp. TL-2023a]
RPNDSQDFSTQTEFYGPTFSTRLMMDQMANPYAQNRKWTVSCPRESEVLKIHQEVLCWQSVDVHRVLEAMAALRETLEYSTSLVTYTVRSPDQGYLHDGMTIGSVYRHFHRDKAALDGLSDLLNHQKVLEANSNWQGNMEHLSKKFGVWVKEMGWVDEAFVGGLRRSKFASLI